MTTYIHTCLYIYLFLFIYFYLIYMRLLKKLSKPLMLALKLMYKKTEPYNERNTFFSGMTSLLDNFKQTASDRFYKYP